MHSGKVDTAPLSAAGTQMRAWFCPGRGDRLAHRIAKAIGTAQRRIRIASPVISSGPVLGTLAQVAATARSTSPASSTGRRCARCSGSGTRTGTPRGRSRSCARRSPGPLLRQALDAVRPGSVHDYMHAKVTVADELVFVGSFNLSHSGELNAENVLEIADAGLAEQLAAFIDAVRARYPALDL